MPENASKNEAKTITPGWAHLVAGAAGGILGGIVTSPLEVVKTRLQSGSNNQTLRSSFKFGLGTFNTLQVLKKEEGFRGLYRGLGAHLLGVIPARSIHFFTYGNSKEFYSKELELESGSSLASVLAGITAGFVVVTFAQPIWLVKTRLQLQSKNRQLLYRNSFDAVKKIYWQEGPKAFYKGMSASYLGIAESTLQFYLYEFFKKKFKKKDKSGACADKISPMKYLLAASLAKLFASASTYPHEVIRTRLREPGNTLYKGVFSGLITIYRNEGIYGLYGGMAAHLIRVVPNAAIMFLTYEAVITALSRNEFNYS